MLACWTLPMPATPGSFSQKQPPACESSQKFAASHDQLCSADHQLSGVRSIAHTSSGAAATCAVWATVKPMSLWSMTLACNGAANNAVASAAQANTPLRSERHQVWKECVSKYIFRLFPY